MFIVHRSSFIVRMALTLALCAITITPCQGATFYATTKSDTSSSSTVKLIRQGKVFADATDVYTMTWNGTDETYVATLDDGTFVPDYYRVEVGSGNVVIDQTYITGKAIEGDHIEDIFVRNNADDVMRGALTIRPASGTTNVQLTVDNSSGDIELLASDTVASSSSGHNMYLRAATVYALSSSGANIPLIGIAANVNINSAVNKAQLDSTRGSGWTYDSGNNTIMGLRADLDAMTGSGNFSANDTLNLTGAGFSGGIRLNWAFDPAGVNDSVDYYQVYYGAAAVPGYAQSGAAGLSSATLALIRSNLNRMEAGDFTSWSMPTIYDWYCIVVAFDYDGTAWGSNQVLVSSGNVVDNTTPVIGDATSVSGALTSLANEINNVQSLVGTSGIVKQLFVSNTASASSSATLTEYYNTSTSASNNIVCAYYKSSLFDKVRLSGQGRHSAAAGDNGKFYLVVSTLSTSTQVSTTAATDFVMDLDCSSLADGWYTVTMQIADSDNSTGDTALVKYVTIEALNN